MEPILVSGRPGSRAVLRLVELAANHSEGVIVVPLVHRLVPGKPELARPPHPLRERAVRREAFFGLEGGEAVLS